MSIRLCLLRGSAIEPHLDDVARLRIEVFRDWPYLYDGDMAYERDYLAGFAEDLGALVVGAFDGERMVGASTAAPLAAHKDDFVGAFEGQSLNSEQVYYLAESVLLPDYRGHGLGHAFFDAREAEARHQGFSHTAFCAVIRPDNHPDRPNDVRALEPFWRGRGYTPLDGAIARFAWREVGAAEETEKPLQFWSRRLDPTSQ